MLDSRKNILIQNKAVEDLFRAKALRRKALARLPFKEKINILLQLQKMAKGVNRPGISEERFIWMI